MDDWLAENVGPDPDTGAIEARWTSLTCGLSVPRQNGKNALLEIRELFGLVGRGEKVLHTAHQVKTAQKHFRRLKYFFGKRVDDPAAAFPELNARVAEIRSVNGQEAIYLKNGGSIEIAARSQSSGRGFTVDVIVCDEAQDMSDDDLEALLSTSAAGPKGNPQWIFTGTPPGPLANGEVFTRVRIDALGKSPDRITWHEWSCPAGIDLDDVDRWAESNPALGVRVSLAVVRGERARFSDGGFARERLGTWPSVESFRRVIPTDVWGGLATEDSPPIDAVPAALAVDASHDRLIAIAGCWLNDGEPHIELLNVEYVTDLLGAVDWFKRWARPKRIPVWIAGDSPAAPMLAALQAAKVQVKQANGRDLAKACGLLLDDVNAGRLTHADQRQLNDALAGAKKRSSGTAGGWVWERKDPAVNLAPLVAATLARYGASGSRRRSGPAVVKSKVKGRAVVMS